MARRIIGGAEGRRIQKEAEKKEKFKRAQNTRTERKTLLITCEDSKSSKLYFEAIFSDLKKNHAIAATSLVIAKHQHTDPCGVLQDLCNHKNHEEFDHRWIVIDRDEERTHGAGHTLENFNQAIAQAKSKQIQVAYANPCFEIWYLLHFEYRNTAIDRDELVKKLEHDYRYTKSKLFTRVLNQELQKTAIQNSKQLTQSWVDSQGSTIPATDNPSTNVHELIGLLNGFKK